MRFRYVFPLILGLFGHLLLPAQTCDTLRYRQAIFQVQKSADVHFGTAPAMPAVYVNENVTVSEDLLMDIYQPVGDTLSRRPVFMFAFGGAFLIGSKEDEDARALCDSFARKGYVTASINYRLGMNVADASSGERAVFRAMQDWSAAIRFLKEKSDSLRLDTNYFFAGGVSAGSVSAMHCQYMGDNERPASTFASGLPFPAPDLGCRDCSGNTFAHSSRVRALVNAWGAIGDTSWIQSTENVPMASFHGDLDPVVPYGRGFPFTALITLPEVYGSSLIHPRLQNLGIYSEFYPFPGEGHNIWGTIVSNNFVGGPTQYWDPILVHIRDYLWHLIKPTTGVISGVGYSYPNAIETYSVPAQPGFHWCWTVNGGTIVSSNPHANTIDIQWQTLGLRTITARAFSHLDAAADTSMYQVVVGPSGRGEASPGLAANLHASLSTDGQFLMVQGKDLPVGTWQLSLVDIQGRTMAQAQGMGSGRLNEKMDVAGIESGIYLLTFESGKSRGAIKVAVIKP